jgi:hypothetical protein
LDETRSIGSSSFNQTAPRGDGVKKTKTTEITVETDEFFVIKRRDRSAYGRCETCGALVPMVTLAEAAGITRETELVIYGQIRARLLHSTQKPEGQVLICLNSLLT